MTSKRFALRTSVAAAAASGRALGATGPAQAQTKLEVGARLRDVSEPYHKWSVWAGDEIKKRTNGRYEVQVFPASSLGQGVRHQPGPDARHRSTSSSPARASPAAPTRRSRSSYFPFIFRDADHMLKYAKSDVFKELTTGYDEKSGNHVTALTYYGARHVTSRQRGRSPSPRT